MKDPMSYDSLPQRHHNARQIFLNTFAGLASSAGSALVGLVVTPFLIARLGVEAFGFWAVLTAVSNYAGLVDGGLNGTFMKYIAEYSARHEIARVRQVVTFGALFYVVIGLAVTPLAYVAARPIIGYMHVSEGIASQGPFIFASIVLSLFLTSAAGAIGSILSGLGRLRTVWSSNFFSRTVFSVSAAILCGCGLGLKGMVIATFLQVAVFAVIISVAARRLFGSLFEPPWRWEAGVIRQLFTLGGWIQVTNACTTIVVESNRFVISAFISTTAVTYFEVASRLVRVARSLPFNFIVALLPAVSARNAASEADDFNTTYVRATRYVNFITMALVGFIIAAGTQLCHLWIGTVYPNIGEMVALIGIYFICINATMVGTTMLRATGLAKLEAFYYLVWTAVTVALLAIFVPLAGMHGVLISMAIGSAIGSAYFFRLLHRLRNLDAWSGFLSWALPLTAIGGVSITATAITARALDPHFPTRLSVIPEVIILAAVYLAIFALLSIVMRFFAADDFALARRVIPPGLTARLVKRARPAV